MLKLIVISALLYASLQEASAGIKNASDLKEVKLQNRYSYTVPMNSHLYTIASKWTHLLVNSTDEKFKSCVIDNEGYFIQKKLEATVIKDKIIVWGIRAKYDLGIGTRIDHTVLIVDPWKCSLKAVSTFEEERPADWINPTENIARVVVRNDHFDVFYPSLQTCAPCRYSIDGKRIDMKYQLQPENATHYGSFFRILNYRSAELNDGYLYTYDFGNGSSVIKQLNANFEVFRERQFEHRLDAVSVNEDAYPTIHVCYINGSRWDRNANSTIICEWCDSDLTSVYKIRVKMLDGHPPEAFSVNIDANLQLYIAVAQAFPHTNFIYYHYDSLGIPGHIVKLHPLPKDTYGSWRVHGFFSDNKYCVEFINDSEYYAERSYELVKCFNQF